MRRIFRFWAPLAAQWAMMAVEGPFLAAVIARLADPKFNLAAHGVAFAFAILVEAPVIMLLSASTALVRDRASYEKLRRFTYGLSGACTAVLLLLLVPPVYALVMDVLLGLPAEVSRLTYGALWFLLPWPAAIGYRRFLHGVLIRSGRTRLVAVGTVLRISGMGAVALVLYFFARIPGAWVGAAALSTGVCTEAVAARWMARGSVAELTRDGAGGPAGADTGAPWRDVAGETGAGAGGAGAAPEEHAPRVDAAGAGGAAGAPELPETLSYGGIARFYYPLALTSVIGLTVQPMLTFFMGRAPAPVESLAVFPVVHALSFLFRAPGLSYQEVVIALLGRRAERFPELARFGTWLGLAASGGLALVAFTPLASVWFETISGLTPELAAFALTPTRILVPLPALSVLLAVQRALLVEERRTRPITLATIIEVVLIAVLFATLGWGAGLIGVTAAALAFLVGRVGGVAYLVGRARRALTRLRSRAA